MESLDMDICSWWHEYHEILRQVSEKNSFKDIHLQKEKRRRYCGKYVWTIFF